MTSFQSLLGSPVYLGIVCVTLLWIGLLIFQWLWNSTLPELFGWKTISMWQAFKLLLLAAFLFGGKLPLNYTISSNHDGVTTTYGIGATGNR